MSEDYLFLIPLTPTEYLDNDRRALRDLCFEQIKKLKSTYRVWLLGDSIHDDLGFDLINLNAETKEDKLFEVGKLLEKSESLLPRYLVRLDDDDLINPKVFDDLASRDFDCAYDANHWFYDLSSGMTSSQPRNWIPNTAIHAMSHALTKVKAQGGSAKTDSENYLFACDHSQAWHTYYAGKNTLESSADNPLYLRILTPHSITARNQSKDAHHQFVSYLNGFGEWNAVFPLDFEVKKQLCDIYSRDGRELQKYEFPKNSRLSRALKRLKNSL